MTEKTKGILLILLTISLAFNFASLFRFNSLENNIAALQATLSANFTSRFDSLSYELEELLRKKENLLGYEFKTNLEKSKADAVYLNLDFTLREVGPEEQVRVFFRAESDSSAEWTEALITATGGNSYQAELLLSGQEEYLYKIQAGNRVEMQALVPGSYYLLGQVSLNAVSVILVNDRATEMHFDLFAYGIVFYPPEKISLYCYGRQDELLRTQKLYQATSPENTDTWQKNYTCSLENVHRVEIEVVYQDGRIDRGDIWPEPDYVSGGRSY